MRAAVNLVRASLFGGLLLLSAGGCDLRDPPARPPDAPSGTRLRDDAGRPVAFARPPERIVSLVPSATEILIALGAADRLVARTDFDEAPGLAALPSVGGGLAPSMERIVAVGPDLVIAFRAGSDESTPRLLDQAGIPHLAVRPDGIRDIHRIVRLLGDVLDRREVADSLLLALSAATSDVSARVAGADRPRVAYLLGGDPPLVAGAGTFLHELVELAGGTNVFLDLALLYAPVSVEEVIRRNVDLLFVGEGNTIPAGLANLRVMRLPASVEIPGLGLAVSARRMAEALHPDRFP